MKNMAIISVALFAASFSLAGNILLADEITFYGDFEDGFDSGLFYESSIPYEPGSFDLVFSELVLGIPKFDPSLGTLTDITVFISDTDPIFYDIGGSIETDEIDDEEPGFSAAVDIFGDIGLNYESPSFALDLIITDFLDLTGSCSGEPGDLSCGDGLFPSADGVLDGSESVIGFVDLADFVGIGDVDSLYVQLFLESTALFSDVINADAYADTFYDIYDSDSGADDSVVGVTYTYTPIPEPTTYGLALAAKTLGVGRKACAERTQRCGSGP